MFEISIFCQYQLIWITFQTMCIETSVFPVPCSMQQALFVSNTYILEMCSSFVLSGQWSMPWACCFRKNIHLKTHKPLLALWSMPQFVLLENAFLAETRLRCSVEHLEYGHVYPPLCLWACLASVVLLTNIRPPRPLIPSRPATSEIGEL